VRGVLHVALTGPVEDETANVGRSWRELDAGDETGARRVHEVPWPPGADVVSSHQLVVGVVEGVPPPASDAVDAWTDTAGAFRLWRERVVPFAANLAAGRRAPRRRVAELVDSDPSWPVAARRLILRLRDELGAAVVRIDHIGSTSVPGLPAKDLLDVQVVVPDLETGARLAGRASGAGLVDVGEWDAPDRGGARFAERVLVDADPWRPTNVNLRAVTDPVWRETLLFRDWLRADDRHRDAYLDEKCRLAAATGHVDDYSDGKLEWIGDALGRAEAWAAATSWSP
jgi:GrpB-like predicted nucleotidyltransferase (UPF0157 family)